MPRRVGVMQEVPAQATLKGSDLYRLNCQGCHGESGAGTAPEINSVINPVRSTSVALVMERMKNTGMDIGPGRRCQTRTAVKSGAATETAQRGREHAVLFPLERNRGPRAGRVSEGTGWRTRSREGAVHSKRIGKSIGELVVKSTCHTCHSAVGPDPGPQQLLDGAIPPLNTLTTRKSQPEFNQKVTVGAPILMGTPPLLCRGRMPVFYYLSEEEAADAYLYLTRYPPAEEARSEPAIALLQQEQGGGPPSGGSASPSASLLAEDMPAEPGQPEGSAQLRTVVLSLVVAFVFVLLAGGLAFTLREFRWLSVAATRTSGTSHGAYVHTLTRNTPTLSRSLTSSALSTSSRR